MVKRIILIIGYVFGILCSQIDIGTDVDRIGNVVKSGVVQPGWSYHDASYKSSPPQGEIYFYVKGLDLLGPTYEVIEFHHDDETKDDNHKWIFMNVTIDEKIGGLFKDYVAYKIDQECIEREGGSTIRLNVTMKALTCDPITFNWMKVCGEPTATKEDLNVGLSKTTSEIVKKGVVTSTFDGNIKNDIYKVTSEDLSTKFYLYHSSSFAKTFYKEPYIITDHEVLYPTILGSPGLANWLESDPVEFEIVYNCLVSDGIREELILVIELPYFHDLEIHFFKTCGIKAQSGVKFSTILIVIGIIAVGLCVGYAFNRYQGGDEIIDLHDIKKTTKECLEYWRYAFGRLCVRAKEKESLDIDCNDDDGKLGLNVHTVYGTI